MELMLRKLPPEILSIILEEIVRGKSLGEMLPWMKLFTLFIPEEMAWKTITTFPSLNALFEPHKISERKIHGYWESYIIVQEANDLYSFIDHEGNEIKMASLFSPIFNDKFCLIVTFEGISILTAENRLLHTSFKIKCKNIYSCSLVHSVNGWLVIVSFSETNMIEIYRIPEKLGESIEAPINSIGPFLNTGRCAYYARDYRKEIKELYMGEGYMGFYTPQGIFSYLNGDLIEKVSPSSEMLIGNPKHMKQVWYVNSKKGIDIMMTFNTLFFYKVVEGTMKIIWSAPTSELNNFDTCVLDHYIALGHKVFDIQTGDVLFTSPSNKIAALTRKKKAGFYVWESQ